MTPCKSCLCIDAGGTFFKSALFSYDGKIICSNQALPVDSHGEKDKILKVYAEIVECMKNRYIFSKIGIAIPGPFDYKNAKSLMTHKFKSIYGLDMRNELKKIAGENIDIFFVSDTNAFLLGSKKKSSNCIGLTIGTGLGCAVIKDGKLLTNQSGGPAEVIYNIPVGDMILEDYISGRGISEEYKKLTGERISAKEVSIRAHENDRNALKVFDLFGSLLGKAVASMVDKYNSDRIILGGQVSKSLSLFQQSMLNELKAGVEIFVEFDFNIALKGVYNVISAHL